VDTATLDRVAVEARPRLVAIAYRMLGSLSDAEDVVQDALLKAHRAAPDDVDSPVAYLTTITTRTAIDHLRSARVRRESYHGPWLPEPVSADPAPEAAARAELSDTLSMAFLVMLETLGPEERAAFVLHEVFGYPHRAIADMLGTTEAASRQLLHRARVRLDGEQTRYPVDAARRDELVQRFLAASQGGDLDAFLTLLTEDAVFVSDGGGKARAARYPVRGRWRVGRLLAYLTSRRAERRRIEVVTLNGESALALVHDSLVTSAVFLAPGEDGRVGRIWVVRNPDKLAQVQAVVDAGPRP
jgi:RNA polymerase sigma-70 factor (ECF subfamily)